MERNTNMTAPDGAIDTRLISRGLSLITDDQAERLKVQREKYMIVNILNI